MILVAIGRRIRLSFENSERLIDLKDEFRYATILNQN